MRSNYCTRRDFQIWSVSICMVLYSRSRVDHRVKSLSEALMTELDANQSILLHGGPQSSRRAVLLLNKLGKAHQVMYSSRYCGGK